MANGSARFSGSQIMHSAIFKDLTTLRIFVRTVEIGSFSEVARRIDVTPAMVSKRIATLESEIGQRLLNRDTRRLVVTEAGERLYAHCMRALVELDQAAEELANMQDTPSGCLRLTVPAMLGRAFIAPQLPRLLKTYPQLSVEVNFSMEKVDLYEARMDIAVRIADTIDAGLVAVKLAPYVRAFCASPEYLQRHGTPLVPSDLMNHNCLITKGLTMTSRWPVTQNGEITHVGVKGNLLADNGEAVRYACLEGVGIMMAPRWLLDADLRAGRLVEVLKDYVPRNRAVYAVLLNRAAGSIKIQVGLDFLKSCLSDHHSSDPSRTELRPAPL